MVKCNQSMLNALNLISDGVLTLLSYVCALWLRFEVLELDVAFDDEDAYEGGNGECCGQGEKDDCVEEGFGNHLELEGYGGGGEGGG